jgi:hypothetical protein
VPKTGSVYRMRTFQFLESMSNVGSAALACSGGVWVCFLFVKRKVSPCYLKIRDFGRLDPSKYFSDNFFLNDEWKLLRVLKNQSLLRMYSECTFEEFISHWI